MHIPSTFLAAAVIMAGNLGVSWASDYRHTPNAAISGYNNKQLTGVSVRDCMNACNREPWCKSFDYYKGQQKCDLSDKSASEVGGLKTNYDGNPYDHYALVNAPDRGTDPAAQSVEGTGYSYTPNAAISGYNNKQLTGVSVRDCMNACNRAPWCKSFDYYKGQQKCDLSDKSASEVGGLKTDYDGNPYDHYSRTSAQPDSSDKDEHTVSRDDQSPATSSDISSSNAVGLDEIINAVDDQALTACLQRAYDALLNAGLKVTYRRDSAVFAHNADFRARVRCPKAGSAVATTGITVISRGKREPVPLRDTIVEAMQ